MTTYIVPRHDICACGRNVVRPTQPSIPTHCPCGITYVLERAAGRKRAGHVAYGRYRGLVVTDQAAGS